MVNIEENVNGLNNFLDACKRILNIHAPHKQKYARNNHMFFINKALSKKIMTRTRLWSKFLKGRNEKNKNKINIKNNAIIAYHYQENLNRTNSTILMRKIWMITKHFGNIKGALSGLRQFLETESPLKMMKNAFYLTSKVLFVLKIFNFLSWLFWLCNKTAWLGGQG